METITVHEAIARSLLAAGQETIFGLLGDGNMQYCANYMDLGGQFIGAVHEGNAVSMADGHARETDRVTAVSVTHGPAVTNTLTALTEAVRAGSPVLLLSGDTPERRDFVQHLDLRAAASLAGASYRRVLRPEHVVDDITKALSSVETTRVPMLLDIPHALLNDEIDYEPSRFTSASTSSWTRPTEESLDTAVGILASAQRPVVLAGAGAVRSEAREELVALAEQLGAPLATTLLAKDYFSGVPGHVGVCGTVSHDIGIEAISSADCLVVFGASLNQYTAAHGDLLRGKAIVQCDTDPAAPGRHFPVDAGLVGDAAATARAIRRMLDEAEITPRGYNSESLRRRLSERDPRREFSDAGSEDLLDMRTAMIELDEALPAHRTVVTDTGRFMGAPWKYLHVGGGGRFHHTVNFGSIGLGLATALGAAVANRAGLTVAVAGDGGVAMSYMELATAAREKLPLVVVILDDGCYGAEYTKLAEAGLNPQYSLLDSPDLCDVARSLGCEAIRATDTADLHKAAALVEEGHLPLVIDVRADPGVDPGVLNG
ncbi:thiamine pyrophosphate-binding protein [Flexivirga endophytica]|nr:thiamine pyrophosphate-binding protein [Flexivirga endophytica]